MNIRLLNALALFGFCSESEREEARERRRSLALFLHIAFFTCSVKNLLGAASEATSLAAAPASMAARMNAMLASFMVKVEKC